MALGELELLSRRQLDLTVIVFNDASLSLIKLKQGANQGGQKAIGYAPISFAGVAEAFGIASASASDCAEFSAALDKSAGVPFLIDAHIDPADYVDIIKTARG